MREFKVIALSVGGRGNKIFHSGDTVNESNFIDGRADELVSQKFLEEVKDETGLLVESLDTTFFKEEISENLAEEVAEAFDTSNANEQEEDSEDKTSKGKKGKK